MKKPYSKHAPPLSTLYVLCLGKTAMGLPLKDLGRNDTGLMSTFTATTEEELTAGQLYPVTLEFRENYGAAEAHLLWHSDSQPLEVGCPECMGV